MTSQRRLKRIARLHRRRRYPNGGTAAWVDIPPRPKTAGPPYVHAMSPGTGSWTYSAGDLDYTTTWTGGNTRRGNRGGSCGGA